MTENGTYGASLGYKARLRAVRVCNDTTPPHVHIARREKREKILSKEEEKEREQDERKEKRVLRFRSDK